MALLVEIIGAIEFEHQVAIDRRRVARRIVGARRSLARIRSPRPGSGCGNRRSNSGRCPTSLSTPCGVDRKRSFDQRRMMLPRLIRNVPGMIGGANHSPDGSRTASPGTSVRASAVIKLLSVCGAWPNRLSSAVVLRRVMQEPHDGMRLVGEERREILCRHAERHGKGRQHAVAHRAERARNTPSCRRGCPAVLGRPLIAAAQRLAGDHVGMLGPRSWLTKKLSFWLGLVALCTVEAPCTEALIGR